MSAINEGLVRDVVAEVLSRLGHNNGNNGYPGGPISFVSATPCTVTAPY